MTGYMVPRIRLSDHYSSNHIILQTGGLGVNVKISELSNSIVGVIEQFGAKLYYGYPQKHVFLNHFYSHKRYSLIQHLKNFDINDANDKELEDIGLYLYMSRIAQSQQWKYPALLSRLPDGTLAQETGGTRAFAVGLTKPEPWNHFPILMLEEADKDISQILNDPVHVASDKHLTEIFGADYDENIWDPTVRLTIHINKATSGQSYCLLKHVDDYTLFNNNTARGREYLEKFIEWKKVNPLRPKLKIYTNYPNRVHDINGVWDWEIAGDTGNFETAMGDKTGWVERLARTYHIEDCKHGTDYVLWLVKDRTLDLGDLLPWMDNQYSTYISNDWTFVLYRPSEMFSSTFIDASYQE